MCRVKIGKKISCLSDVQNLIIGIILRQQDAYKEEDILRMTSHFMHGSDLHIPEVVLKKIVRRNLEQITMNKMAFYKKGYYIPSANIIGKSI